MKKHLKTLGSDLPSGVVVFLVALPLCLGIALASGAPLFAGIISGVVGGIVVGFFSGSHLSVSGPAAGLTVIVLTAITDLGSYEIFLLAVFIGGLIQLILGILKAGIIGHFFPSSVIKGMLSAIGLILILKQIPHALGDDRDYEGDEAFLQFDGENTFTEIALAVQNIDPGAFIICGIALGILILWETRTFRNMSWTKIIPGPLVAIILAVFLNSVLFNSVFSALKIGGKHLVRLPEIESFTHLTSILDFPDFSQLLNPQVYITAFTIAIVASLETLLSLDAVDKLDPYKRIAPASRELRAQGIGNMVCGLIGGLPVTSVIVRSTANVSSGAKTKASAIIHGFFLGGSVLFFPQILNLIPLSALAAVLLMVGYKLAKPSLFKEIYGQGKNQFLPFIITIGAILFTDLLIGIIVGIIVGLVFVIKANLHQSILVKQNSDDEYIIKLEKDVSFLNKAMLRHTLRGIPEGSSVIFDESESIFIDHDIVETIQDFEATARNKNISIKIRQPKSSNNKVLSQAS
ncbi:SulP family inorganic anion transporter [Marinoscillum sp. MHG1-6]|uniref:SulP family inorganic anion transporter n=1 Tax=Marinoscillum sp. MHG1-6 TaxID=2959627 RepID=UPI0021575CDC|nr:SulP family inorganic anion transporter [Marinoscillum sp. MHG1-6]